MIGIVHLAIIVLLHSGRFTEALRCLRCDGVNPDNCLKSTTSAETCDPNQKMVCKSFFYFSQGEPKVEKGCMQEHSCNTQQAQENKCEQQDGKDKPCRCCCSITGCDYPRTGCVVPGKCSVLRNPKVGKYLCKGGRNEGATCTFSCPKEYEQTGSKTITCTSDPETSTLQWFPKNQRCSKNTCKPPSPQIANGKLKCTNKPPYEDRPNFIYKGTLCVYTCDIGYRREGPASRLCNGRKWIRGVPKCIPVTCNKFRPAANRIDTYSDRERKIDSTASFRCKRGFKLLGNKEATCVRDPKNEENGRWDREPGKCVKIRCLPEQNDPTNGMVSCTNENIEGSVCTFTCDKGYTITDSDESSVTTTCVDDEDGDVLGEWTNPPATCTIIECQPKFKDPENGQVSCTKSNRLGSVCTFVCDYGYDVNDSVRTKIRSECEDDRNGDSIGKWSFYPSPTCTKIKCMPPHVNPENGKVSCSDVNNLGSVCKFTCNKGYDLEGTTSNVYESECEDDGDGDALGEWSKGPPKCVIIECDEIKETETLEVTCSDEYRIGSVCDFRCKFGYELIGETDVECIDKNRDGDSKGEWSGEIPKCTKIFCKNQKHDNTVVRTCDPPGTNRFQVDTVCTYECAEEGYYMVSFETPTVAIKTGKMDVTCLEEAIWDRRAPRCIPVQCSRQKLPKNAHSFYCTNDNWLGSECEFNCLPTYKLTHTEKPVCESDGTDNDTKGKWSVEAPKCEKNECEPFKRIKNGRVDYSNFLIIGSILTLTCDAGYTYKEHTVAECMPPDDENKMPHWNQTINVCCVPCIYNTNFRLVSLLDKTLAQSEQELREIVTWHFYLLDFLFTNGYTVKFSLVFYDETVDKTNSRDEVELISPNDLDDIRFDMITLPYGGRKSDTAEALKYARDEYLLGYIGTGNFRPGVEPFVLIMKRGDTSSEAVDVARELRNNRIHIMGMTFREGLLKSEETGLVSLTGAQDLLFKIGGVSDLVSASETFNRISREQGCSKASRNRSCPK